MLKALRAAFVLAVALPGLALAQTYVASTSSEPYPVLTAPTLVGLQGHVPNDDGRATVPLGFSFPFFARSYTSLVVTANGMAFLEQTSCSTCDYPANSALPFAVPPNGVLAPLWDDLSGSHPASRVQMQALSGPDGAGLAIEWVEWNHWTQLSTYSLTFQLRLWEDGLIEFLYGPMSGNGAALTAGVGIEDPTGTIAVLGKPCGSSPGCGFSDFQSNERIRFGPGASPDLFVAGLEVSSIDEASGTLQVHSALKVRNFGQAAASNFTYRLYLSTNTTFEPGTDLPLTPSPLGPLSVGAMATATDTATSSCPKPGAGAYYLLAVLDDANAVAESDETNNVGVSVTSLHSGIDLVAEAIHGPPSGGPGEGVTTALRFHNAGLEPAGTFGYRIWLSVDASFDPADLPVHSGTVALAGGESANVTVSFPLPATVPAGDYHFVLELDGPAPGVVAELNEANNVVVDADRFTARQADLANGPVEVSSTQGRVFFGEPVTLQVEVSNLGGATASGYQVSFYLSANASLNAFSDAWIGSQPGPTLTPGAKATVTLLAPVPLSIPSGASLIPGSYFFLAAADPGGHFLETTTVNNLSSSGQTAVQWPAPDLAPTTVVGPAFAGAGEPFQVARTIRNLGNRDAPAASYRYYLSANALVSEADILLPLEVPGGPPTDHGTVTLPAGGEDLATEWVRLPPNTPAGHYFIGVLVDPPNAVTSPFGPVTELDEGNNALAGTELEVVAPTLTLVPRPLNDAVVAQPYSFQLAARGTQEPATFELVAGNALPPGLTLDAGGLVRGTPTVVGVFGFTVTVRAGSQREDATLVLRVVPIGTPLQIRPGDLPRLSQSLPYEAWLSAQGGQGPYRWSLVNRALPQGLNLSEDGSLTGTTGDATGATAPFTIEVRDALGTTAVASFTLAVRLATPLMLLAEPLPEAVVGAPYLIDIRVRADPATIERPIHFEQTGGALPPGMALRFTEERALVEGTPSAPGLYAFTLEVSDAGGNRDSAGFVISVYPAVVSMVGSVPSTVLRGQSVSTRFSLADDRPAQFTLRGGELPAGLKLDLDGTLGGEVALDAEGRSYPFAVRAHSSDGADALAAFSMEVTVPPTPSQGCGCGSTSSGLVSLGSLLVGSWAMRRRPPLKTRPGS